MPRTKIVCTLGPSSDSEGVLRGMMRAGMEVARVNFSHGDHAIHARRIAMVRRLAEEEGRVVAVMGDLQGPKLRIGDIAGGTVNLQEGAEFDLTVREVPGDERAVHFPHPQLLGDLAPGDRILLDDGKLELSVLSVTPTDIRCRVVVGGPLGSRKGVTIPKKGLSLPALTDKDLEDALFAVEQGVDYLALSFVRRPEDVLELRRFLARHGASVPIIAKIEKREAVEAFPAILEVSDGAMVARGDLGVESTPEEVPLFQKSLIRQANEAGKPVITATQMLSSMMENPRPTRAEASDVANAILDGSDALMLSGETAVGKYPVEAVQMMARIAETTEREFPYKEWARRIMADRTYTVTDAIGQATCELALELGAKAIITPTMSGYTARMVARHRPPIPIIATTPEPAVQRRLALVWGVHPLLITRFASTDEMLASSVQVAMREGFVQRGDLVIITAGVPLGGAGKTNMLKVHRVGEE